MVYDLRSDRRVVLTSESFNLPLCRVDTDVARHRRRRVRTDIVEHGPRMVGLGTTTVPSCDRCAGSDHTGGSDKPLPQRDQQLSLSALLLLLPLCMMNADVANQGDTGWEFTLSANCADLGMTMACGGPRCNAPLGGGCG